MKFKVKILHIEANLPVLVLNEKDAEEIGVNISDRMELKVDGKKYIGVLDTTKTLVKERGVGINLDMQKKGLKKGMLVEVKPTEKPKSLAFIKKKLRGEELSKEEIKAIIKDIVNDNLSDIELGAYVASVYAHDFTLKETINVIHEMVKTGTIMKWRFKNVVDKHSIGGVPGNRVTPIIVSIIAAAGLTIPKTSSRAITSAAGTADVVEIFSGISFTKKEIKKIVEKAGGCMIWNGALDLAPSDDKIIKAEYPLSLDPEGQLLASVISKKKAMGAKAVVIDIPYGYESKMESLEKAEALAKKFKEVGERLDMKIRCVITRGEQPIGNGIGPVLEAIDVLKVLDGREPKDLREKSLELAGLLLEMMNAGDKRRAEEILDSGKALKKFKEIIKAQHGNPDIDLKSMLGKFTKTIYARKDGDVIKIHNKELTQVARAAGAPKNKGSGIYIYVKLNDRIKKNDKLFEIYAESKHQLDEAYKLAEELSPIEVGTKNLVIEEKF